MKKIFLCLVAFISFSSYVIAQEPIAAKAETSKQLTKEQTAEVFAKKEADLVELFKRADLNDDQQTKSRAVIAEYSTQSKVVKADELLSVDVKKIKLKELSTIRNNKLKEIMGDAQYKAYEAARKAQKDANEVAGVYKN